MNPNPVEKHSLKKLWDNQITILIGTLLPSLGRFLKTLQPIQDENMDQYLGNTKRSHDLGTKVCGRNGNWARGFLERHTN